MPRPRKTSTQPKRKTKAPPKIVQIVYPEFIEKFKAEIKEKTPFVVDIDQYSDSNSYHVGILRKEGRVHHCVWMVGFATTASELNRFWASDFYKRWKETSA